MLTIPALRRRLMPTLLSMGLITGTSVVYAELVTDPANDFLPSYIGPKNGDMDALSSEVTFNPANDTFTFTGTVNAPVGTTQNAAWVWGLDRGKGTERFLPAFGAGVKFDSVVALFANQTGSFIDLVAGTPPTSLPAGSVHVSGNTISATVPLSMLPSEGFGAQGYTWNFWPEAILAQPSYVSDFAPDARNAALTVVPEPSSLALLVAGTALVGVFTMLRRGSATPVAHPLSLPS